MKCQDCDLEMTKAECCTCPILVVNGIEHKRNTDYYDHNERCHDCGIVNKKNNLHHFGCDMERCPICGGQLISCGCLDNQDYEVR